MLILIKCTRSSKSAVALVLGLNKGDKDHKALPAAQVPSRRSIISSDSRTQRCGTQEDSDLQTYTSFSKSNSSRVRELVAWLMVKLPQCGAGDMQICCTAHHSRRLLKIKPRALRTHCVQRRALLRGCSRRLTLCGAPEQLLLLEKAARCSLQEFRRFRNQLRRSP